MTVELKALIGRMSPLSRQAMEQAAAAARSATHHEVDVEHLMQAMLHLPGSDWCRALTSAGISCSQLQEDMRTEVGGFRTGNPRNPVLSAQLQAWLRSAWLVASLEYGMASIRSAHLLHVMLADETFSRQWKPVMPPLAGLAQPALREAMMLAMSGSEESAGMGSARRDEDGSGLPGAGRQSGALAAYTTDLTTLARAGKIDPVTGREGEIAQVIDILLRRRQNNPILTGEPGVGKTAIVEGLALRIVNGEVPAAMRDFAIHALDLGLLQAGASMKGEFEARLKATIDEVKASPHPIMLFIDEAHTLVGAGAAAGQGDAANLLKPALARGELRTIAATTWSEYKRYMEKDAALARRFQVVKVAQPDEETAIRMLRGIATAMEAHHGVRILDEALQQAVTLSSRYLSERQLPDKAVSVLDTACAKVAISQTGVPRDITDLRQLMHGAEAEIASLMREENGDHAERIETLRGRHALLGSELERREAAWRGQQALYRRIDALQSEINAAANDAADPAPEKAVFHSRLNELRAELTETTARLRSAVGGPMVHDCVDKGVVAQVVAEWTGIPLGRMLAAELELVRELRQRLELRIIGQDHALDEISRHMLIARAGLEDPAKPKGVFLLAGPSGVGKTETALALAEMLYGGERHIVTINLSEYQEAHNVATLKGAPPGYVGYGQGGVLTEAVRRRPHCVILLDEAEKAHPDVLELFFQVFDKGTLDDAEGRQVDFRHAVILLCSNAGSATVMRAVDAGVKVGDACRRPTPDDLRELIRPELQRIFKPAFLGRLSVIPYYPLDEKAMSRIVGLKLQKIRDRLQRQYGAAFLSDPKLSEMIVARCSEVDSGARNADAIISSGLLAEISQRVLEKLSVGEPIRQVEARVRRQRIEVVVS
ncbi:type VI secretion system protein VasG [Noviherbaspirillum humi]|uniref:Type VI secretion system protein VasG n=1 Tax=Noviherbaspirillum humi TaxID=1688639 RepID=A0A239DL42_9BURK|nr:type VI secretion system ATPase TssH [Noviherbaspirillum humi]SNS32403.1 type VI secretion system protein VasG [Noviherbaspirillum humi]